MRLNVLPSPESEHATLANAVDWTGGVLASGGDDQHVQRWTSDGQASGQVSHSGLQAYTCSLYFFAMYRCAA